MKTRTGKFASGLGVIALGSGGVGIVGTLWFVWHRHHGK